MGGSGSWLGFPISDELSFRGNKHSNFEGGYIGYDGSGYSARRYLIDADGYVSRLMMFLTSEDGARLAEAVDAGASISLCVVYALMTLESGGVAPPDMSEVCAGGLTWILDYIDTLAEGGTS